MANTDQPSFFYDAHWRTLHTLRLALFVCSLTTVSPAQERPSPPIAAPEPASNPELEDLLTNLEKKWTDTLEDEIRHLHEFLHLDAQSVDALEAQVSASVLAHRNEFKSRLPAISEKLSFILGTSSLSTLVPWLDNGFLAQELPPVSEQLLWSRTLQQTLSREQAAILANSDREFKESIPALLERRKAASFTQLENGFASLNALFETALQLTEERSRGFQELAKNAAASALKDLLASETRRLESLPYSRRKVTQRFANQNHPIFDPSFKLSEQPDWKEGVLKLISAEEQRKVEEHRAGFQKSLTAAVETILLLHMDEACALSPEQREKARPILGAFVTAKFQDTTQVKHLLQANTLHPSELSILSDLIFKSLPETSLQPLLDPNQIKLWKTNVQTDPSTREPEKPDPSPEAASAAPLTEDTERAIADFLSGVAEKNRGRLRSEFSALCENLIRVTQLEPEPAQRLRVAAAGTADRLLQKDLAETEKIVRSHLLSKPGLSPKLSLASLPSYRFNNSRKNSPEDSPLWKTAVKNSLTPEQLALWERSKAAREAFRVEAICQIPVLFLQHAAGLRPEQIPSLAPLIANTIREYEPDILSVFSFGDGRPWYRQEWIALLPLALLQESELKNTLSPEQWKRWSDSNAHQTAFMHADSVRTAHENRLKSAKPTP